MKKCIILISLAALFAVSCKKEKSPTPEIPPVTTSVISTGFHIISYLPSNDSINVNSSINLIDNAGVASITIPLNFGVDTVAFTVTGTYNGHNTYNYDHPCINNPAYHLVGNMYYQNDSTIYVYFQQRYAPFGVADVAANYDLTYRKN